jgi:hypothetical protein
LIAYVGGKHDFTMMLRIKNLLAGTLVALSCLSASADYVYTWVSNPAPPPPHGYTRVTASGYFVASDAAVAAGTVTPSDVSYLFVHMSSPANYVYRTFDGGSLQVDPATGVVLSGSFHSTCSFSTYGRGATFTASSIFCDNTAGGAWSGHWAVTHQ